MLGTVAILAVTGWAPARAATVPVGPSSAYAHARQACRGQDKQLKLVGAQTDDHLLAAQGVAITYVCAPKTAPHPRPRPKR